MPHICSRCESVKIYGSRDALRRHQRLRHGGPQPSFQCPKCSKPPFSRKDHLTRHDKEKHTGEHLSECDLCLGTFSNRYLQEHKATCKSRSFGQVSEPPAKRARTSRLQSVYSKPLSSSQTSDKINARVFKQVPDIKFLRGSVAPKPRRPKGTPRGGGQLGLSMRRQAAFNVVLGAMDLDEKHRILAVEAIETDNIVRLQQIIDRHYGLQSHPSSLKEARAERNPLVQEEISLLHVAAERGSMEAAQILLSAGIGIDSMNTRGRTPFQEAMVSHRFEVAHYLLQRGADIERIDKEGRTALHHCCAPRGEASGAKEPEAMVAVEFLIEHGAKIDAEDKEGSTALCIAVESGMLTVVQRLLQAGASVNGSSKENASTPLIGACAFIYNSTPKFLAIMTMLLQHGADVNLVRCVSRFSEPSTTALTMSLKGLGVDADVFEALSLLLTAGANPNLGDIVTLEYAILNSTLDVVKFLLDRGADASRLSKQCIKILQGRRETPFSWHYTDRKAKWALLQQYYPEVYDAREHIESDTESAVYENYEHDAS